MTPLLAVSHRTMFRSERAGQRSAWKSQHTDAALQGYPKTLKGML